MLKGGDDPPGESDAEAEDVECVDFILVPSW